MMTDELILCSTIGFSGHVHGGLIAHPDGVHIIYPLGSILVIMEKGKPATQRFLTGHKNEITSITVSRSGLLIASGEYSAIDQESRIILWDFSRMESIINWTMHKDSVISLSFSKSDKYLASLGGDDRIVIWDIQNRKGLNGATATIGSSGSARAVCFSNTDDLFFVSAGDNNVRFWKINESSRNFIADNMKLDQTKRIITSISFDSRDSFVFCGTTTGDVMKVATSSQRLVNYGPRKALGEGIFALSVAPWGDIVVGSGCGKVAVLDSNDLHILASCDLNGSVTSVSMVPKSNAEIICGTNESDICSISTDSFKPTILSKGHSSAINDVFFPERSSDMFLTCSAGGFHVWNSRTYQELLRVSLARSECNCIAVPADGKVILTGWSDGRIRGYTPQSGKELWTINGAHLNGVTAIAARDSLVITGGMTGDISLWELGSKNMKLVKTLKEHHQMVSQILFSQDGAEFLSSSHDGSVILWDIKRVASRTRFMGQTFFNGACLHTETGIVVTVSSDKRIIFWDGFNANIIRELEASVNAQPNSICLSPDGETLIISGDDKLVKLWHFQTGDLISVGRGHCGNIKKAIFSPDQSIIVSVGAEGGIYIWKPK